MTLVAGRILWDVDTQVDFMQPSGKLYVPGAADVAPAMERLVDAARAGLRHQVVLEDVRTRGRECRATAATASSRR